MMSVPDSRALEKTVRLLPSLKMIIAKKNVSHIPKRNDWR